MILKLYRAIATKFKTFTNKNEMNEHIQLHTLKNKERLNKSALETLKLLSRHSVKITGVSWLNNETIQEHLNVSLRTIKRAIQRLSELGIVRVEKVEIDGISLRYYVINRFELSPELTDMVQVVEHELSKENEENNAENSIVSREIEEPTTTRNDLVIEHKETNDINNRKYVAADSN